MLKSNTEDEYEISFPIQFHGYRVIRIIGNGSTCIVALVEKIKTKEKFSAKIISKEDAKEKDILQSIKKEIKILKTLNHPNIIKIHESFEIKNDDEEELIIIITEYCENETLLNYAIENKFKNELEKKKIYIKVMKAIKYLHDQGISHGDIKGDNILLDQNLEPKLCDFGFVHLKEIEGDESKYGTLYYSAPELYKHGNFNTLKADIYSLGILMYSINEIQFPFANASPEIMMMQIKHGIFNIRKGISDLFRQIFVKCTDINPNKRPNINDLIDDAYFSDTILHILIDQKKYQEFEEIFVSYCNLLMKNNIKEIKESVFKIYENIIVLNTLKRNMKNKIHSKNNFEKLRSILHPYIQKYNKLKQILKWNDWKKENQYYKQGKLNKNEYSLNKLSGVRYWKKHIKALKLN